MTSTLHYAWEEFTLKDVDDDIEGALAYAMNFIRNLGRQWFDLSPQLHSRFQKHVFPEGIPYDRRKGFGTTRLGLIYELNRRFAGEKSALVDLLGISWNQIIKELEALQSLQFGLPSPFEA